ncbi:MAG: hypothetical protein A2Z11_01455 [Candidatus Woykebacteria bacterium RBG_16_43_9]|uniref:DUF2905 domain-containing protein n=1 Tax=Candidatus Woykebacteria bacterium RBG_16_43_9 TaxID=1802596 RepID=A0A1G1WGJ1_9BACT|nr:MAG: hypothetical protein A2Z11_01455 [Candidatus Woykebacteria bacterium RBG_16_43_9]
MEFGSLLIIFVVIFSLLGIARTLGFKWPKLPGDIVIHKKGFTFAFYFGSSIIISIILNLIFKYFFNK